MNRDFSTHPLTLQALEVLRQADYRTAWIALPQTEASVLVAEHPYAVAAVLGVDQWRQVADEMEAIGTDFVNWALSRQPLAKQWDLYLCLLISQPVTSDEELAEVEHFADDTRYVRRLIRHGIAVDHLSATRTALGALLPLRLPEVVSERDPRAALVEALRAHGVDADDATQTVSRFITETGTAL